VVPCHRVIGADGSLTGFGGGLDIKRKLLALERTHAEQRKGAPQMELLAS
jgi:methylated-DNA-[protein]-cysteine S-methyltransferase